MYARTGIAKLLRAPWNFEVDYDGVSGSIPILFTAPYSKERPAPGVADTFTAVDPEALQAVPPPGISPLLAKMMAVPMGSTLMTMFPIVQNPNQPSPTTPMWAYVWRVVFRLRTLADYQRRKRSTVPWSIPLTRFGTADTRSGNPPGRPNTQVGGERVVRPASSEAVVYNRSAPGPTADAPFFGLLATDAVRIPFTFTQVTNSPLYPGIKLDPGLNNIGNLDYEQGERDPTLYVGMNNSSRNGPFHLPKFVKVTGNEMAVECYKYEIDKESGALLGPMDWDFDVDPNLFTPTSTGADFEFSQLLGIGNLGLERPRTPPKDTGVRVITGAFPQ